MSDWKLQIGYLLISKVFRSLDTIEQAGKPRGLESKEKGYSVNGIQVADYVGP